MFRTIVNFFGTQDKVPFIQPNKSDVAMPPVTTVEKLKSIANDSRLSTLEIELKKADIDAASIECLAKSAMKHAQPNTFLLLATHYPEIITQRFTEETLHVTQPDNTFIAPILEAKKNKRVNYPLSIFDESDVDNIKRFQETCSNQVTPYYVIRRGEIDDQSDFLSCRDLNNRR